MNVEEISRGYIEVSEGARRFRIYGEGLLPKGGGVEYVVYTESPVECRVSGGSGVLADEQPLSDFEREKVVAFLKRWAAQNDRNWDFE